MRENRPYGSEGGGAEFNRSFLPLSLDLSRKKTNLRRFATSNGFNAMTCG